MKKILFSVIFLFTGYLETSEHDKTLSYHLNSVRMSTELEFYYPAIGIALSTKTEDFSQQAEFITGELLRWPKKASSNLSSFLELLQQSVFNVQPKGSFASVFHKISSRVLYFSAGMAFGSASLFAKLGWAACHISLGDSSLENEFLLFSRLCSSSARHAFFSMRKKILSSTKGVPPSARSWDLNRKLLSQVPVFSDEEKKLKFFLEKRWLAKSTGFFPLMVNWIYPCFGIFVQAHPETSSTYARNPWVEFSKTYKNRVKNWKKSLVHPSYFPLILTRPFDLQDYLPACIVVSSTDKIQTIVEKAVLKLQKKNLRVVVDLTSVLPHEGKNPEEWFLIWQHYQNELTKACIKSHLDYHQLLCIQIVKQEEVGGIRLLPFSNQSAKEIDLNHQFLLEWISTFGLSANRIELDRLPLSSSLSTFEPIAPTLTIEFQSKEDVFSELNSFDQNWKLNHFQKSLMLKASLQVLKGLLAAISEEKWNEIMQSPAKSLIAQLSFLKIKQQLDLLIQEKEGELFFDTISHIEQIHADLSSLLEVFAPFSSHDFPEIYRNLLISIPENLKPLITCTVHSSGMTSIGGIFKAMEKAIGGPPRVLYGENTYFEGIKIAKMIANASSIDEATEEDWEAVDLILGQFNPALKRIDLLLTKYGVEKIAETLHKALNRREGKPLTLALDCTLDYIDSPRVGHLLSEFQHEIESGILNVICYRSGLKFDLFGMDNYCGAPFYMIHSQDPKWDFFDLLLTDPALLTDLLSFNWFCLAYQNAASHLEIYRRQIFENTRAFLSKVPPRLFNESSKYRIVPVDQEADVAFVDIKISGFLHQIRGAALAGGSLYMNCMEGGQPIFYRPSLGFYHPNFTMLFSNDNSTIRLTLGLDPAQIDLLVKTFEMIDVLNGSSKKTLKNLSL